MKKEHSGEIFSRHVTDTCPHAIVEPRAGEGVGGVVLTARPGAGGPAAHAITRPDGGFDFKGVPAGRIVLFGTIGEDFRHLGKHEAPATDVEIEVER